LNSKLVREQVLRRLGLDTVSTDADGLQTVYRHWCRRVPFDSLRKRLFQADGARGEVPGWTADEFLDGWLSDGTGGSCWSTSLGLHGLLTHIGFDARLVEGVMLTDPDTRPNHGSVVVRLGGREWLVDSSMLFDDPLLLPRPGRTLEREHPVHPVSVVGRDVDWVVTWRPAHADVRVACELGRAEAVRESWDRAHDFTRGYSLFNQTIYARRNTDDGIIAFGRRKLVERAADGSLHRRDVAPGDVATTLIEHFGFSERIVSSLPADDSGAAFL